MCEVCLVSRADSVVELLLYVVERQAVLVQDEPAAVRQSADMQAASGTLLYLLSVLADDVHESLSDNSISCNEKVDVLSASAVEELVVDGADRGVSVR